MNNSTGGFIALLLLLFLLIRRPSLVLLVPVSLIVLWDFGSLGLAALWAVLLVVSQQRESREVVQQ